MENINNDVSKSIEREQVLKTKVNERGFDILDKASKCLSNIREKLTEEDNQIEEEIIKTEEELEEYQSRLKTQENDKENNLFDTLNNNTSKIKTNVNNENNANSSESKENKVQQTSKLKTNISKKIGFNENQGKISKSITIVSKTGKKIEKTKRNITKLSSDLERTTKGDGTGSEYLKTAAKRGGQNFSKKAINKINKPIKKGIKKITSPITNKLKVILKATAKKAIKAIITFIASYAEIIIPVLFAFILIFGACSIFSTSKETKTSYQTYMTNIQKEYDKEVD